MLRINSNLSISLSEIEITAVRSQGSGGQNVNKVSSAIHLRFDITNSALPESCKAKLLELGDYRITKDGIIIIKAQRYRSQDQNRVDALLRLANLLQTATIIKKRRRATKPSKAATLKRLDKKTSMAH